jgi:transposase
MHDKLFETALGIAPPWSVKAVDFDEAARRLVIGIDFAVGSRFAVPGVPGAHPVHDTTVKEYRHLNFFQHECLLRVRTPRVKLPDGAVRLVEPAFAGRLSGFTLLFEALVLALARQMPFAAVAGIVGVSAYRVRSLCERYVELALEQADFGDVRALAIDETSRARGHDYVTLAADARARRVLFVTEGRDAGTIHRLAQDLRAHGCPPERIESVSIDMSAAFIKGTREALPNAQITFDKFHVVAHANAALEKTRRAEQRQAPALKATLKGLRWALLKDAFSLTPYAGARLHELLTAPRLTLTARAWHYKERLREVLGQPHPQVLREALRHWCTCVMRSRVQPMKEVAALARRHLEGIVAWAHTRQTNGFLEAINGLFQAAKRRARGYGRLNTIRTVLFLIAGRLNFGGVNPHVRQQPT